MVVLERSHLRFVKYLLPLCPDSLILDFGNRVANRSRKRLVVTALRNLQSLLRDVVSERVFDQV